MRETKRRFVGLMLAAALTLTSAAVCAAGAQSKSARRASRKKGSAAAATTTPASNNNAAADTAPTQPAESAPAKRNARGEEKSRAADPSNSATPKGAGGAGPNEAKAVGASAPAAEAQYVYEFENPDFVVNRIRIEHDATGRGRVTFERRSYVEPVVEPLAFSAAAWARVTALWESLRFLDTEESYQAEKQFPHLGTTRLKLRAGGRERATEFNYTSHEQARALASEYRRAADQAIFVFDLSVARESQPLEAPKLLDALDRMIKSNMLSDPEQLIPVLSELGTDERLPLIARNHAARLLKQLKKQ